MFTVLNKNDQRGAEHNTVNEMFTKDRPKKAAKDKQIEEKRVADAIEQMKV